MTDTLTTSPEATSGKAPEQFLPLISTKDGAEFRDPRLQVLLEADQWASKEKFDQWVQAVFCRVQESVHGQNIFDDIDESLEQEYEALSQLYKLVWREDDSIQNIMQSYIEHFNLSDKAKYVLCQGGGEVRWNSRLFDQLEHQKDDVAEQVDSIEDYDRDVKKIKDEALDIFSAWKNGRPPLFARGAYKRYLKDWAERIKEHEWEKPEEIIHRVSSGMLTLSDVEAFKEKKSTVSKAAVFVIFASLVFGVGRMPTDNPDTSSNDELAAASDIFVEEPSETTEQLVTTTLIPETTTTVVTTTTTTPPTTTSPPTTTAPPATQPPTTTSPPTTTAPPPPAEPAVPAFDQLRFGSKHSMEIGPGRTLYGLALDIHQVHNDWYEVQTLVRLNEYPSEDAIPAGEEIFWHDCPRNGEIIQSDDTAEKIALRNNMSVEELHRLNGGRVQEFAGFCVRLSLNE